MSFACVCVVNEPLCLPTGANRKAVKEGSGTGYVELFRIRKAVIIGVQLHSDWLLCYTELKWAEQWKMRVSQERHPPDHSTKRLNVIVPIWQHIICAYCAVVLLTFFHWILRIWMHTLSCEEFGKSKDWKLSWGLYFYFVIFSHKCNFPLFCSNIARFTLADMKLSSTSF